MAVLPGRRRSGEAGSAMASSQATEYRSYGGFGNNEQFPTRGAGLQPYLLTNGGGFDETEPEFSDGRGAAFASAVSFDRASNRSVFVPAGSGRPRTLPTARFLSNALFAFGANVSRPGELPAAPDPPNSRRMLSDMVTYFGHLLSGDIDRGIPSGEFHFPLGATTPEPWPLAIPSCDPVFDPLCAGTPQPAEMAFTRNLAVTNASDSPGRRRAINSVSAFVDLSPLYADDPESAAFLRRDTGGLLRSHVIPTTYVEDGVSTTVDAEFPPLIREIDGPWSRYKVPRAGLVDPGDLFAVGAMSFNGAIPTISLVTLFHRNHNRLARLLSQENPSWDDATLFEEARRRNIAHYQRVTFFEYLPVLLGSNALPPYQGYNASLDPGIDCFFAMATMRYGHSEVGDSVRIVPPRTSPHPELSVPFVQPAFRPLSLLETYDIGAPLLGAAVTVQRDVDIYYSDSLRSKVWDHPNRGGRDEAAIDIERGRDCGCGNYLNARRALGLPVPAAFAEVAEDPALAERMAEAYGGRLELLDALVGAYAEPKVNGGNLGATFFESLVRQFARLRDGDRFYYLADEAGFTDLERAEIGNVTLRKLVLLNSPGLAEVDVPRDLWHARSSGGLAADDGADPLAARYTNVVRLTPDYTIYWRIDGRSIAVAQKLASTSGWAGLAFAAGIGQLMPGADFVVASRDGVSGNASVRQYTANPKGFDRPVERDDSAVRVVNVQVGSDGRSTLFEWTRPLDTGQPGAQVLARGARQLLFAYDTSQPGLTYHGASRGAFVVDLFDTRATAVLAAPSSVAVATRTVHGIGMILVFGIVYPAAIYIARYTRHTDYWLNLHTTAQTFGGVSFVALGTAAAATVSAVAVTNHAIVGITIFSLVVVQLLLGFLARLGLSKRFQGYAYLRMGHRVFGACILLLGWANIQLGLQQQWPSTGWIGNIVVGAWQALLATLFLLTELGWRGIVPFPMPDEVLGPVVGKVRRWLSGVFGGEAPEKEVAAKVVEVPIYGWADVNRRVAEGEEWVVIAGGVYDVSEWKSSHPGGKEVLKKMIGLDATAEFFGGVVPKDVESPADDDFDANLGGTKARRRWRRAPTAPLLDLNATVLGSQAQLVAKPAQKIAAESHAHTPFADGKLASLLVGRLARSTTEKIAGGSSGMQDEFRRFVVAAKGESARGNTARRFTLVPVVPRSGDAAEFLPGQAVEIRARIKKRMVIRSYTPISGNMVDGFDIAVKIKPRGQMTPFLDSLAVGKAVVEVRGPTGTVVLDADSPDGCYDHLLMVAGGSGITPMVQLAHWHAHRASAHDRGPLQRLIYYNRTEAEAMELPDLRRLSDLTERRFVMELEEGEPVQEQLAEGVAEITLAEGSKKIAVCGPAGFCSAVEGLLGHLGVPEDLIYVI
ncbi:heme peroxidase [Hyaloraphidium curvatum]|nr:heme peroxidase [Hyaloraphidium curvatum]